MSYNVGSRITLARIEPIQKIPESYKTGSFIFNNKQCNLGLTGEWESSLKEPIPTLYASKHVMKHRLKCLFQVLLVPLLSLSWKRSFRQNLKELVWLFHHAFLTKINILNHWSSLPVSLYEAFYIDLCACVYVYTHPYGCLQKPEASDPPGTTITGYVGCGNQTLILCKSS